MANSSSPQGFNAFVGWGVSTLLLWLFNRNNDSSTSSDQASKYTSTNTNQIGSSVPVVLGRALVKNPLVSYYGDFSATPYTEEYGMHTGINWMNIVPMIILGIIFVCSTPDQTVTEVSVPVVGGEGGTAQGTATGTVTTSGHKRAMMLNVMVQVLIWLLTQLFMNHMGRTTIQKGFKYYLGWQHIICWTGDKIGVKSLMMNVYDSNVEDSTEIGVWDNNKHIAWKSDNLKGITAHIDDDDMFGGVDENGGFVGDIRIYLGDKSQGKDSWMVSQMTKSENIPTELKGLTPVYPMFVTAVIPTAYIGKQATIPEMWFEIVNYPDNLGLGAIDDDLNPAEAIYEILINKHWGCKYSSNRIDIDSLKEIGKTLATEKLGISCLINNVSTAGDYITKILNHVNGMCYDNPKTGKLTFKLIRANYEVSTLPVFNVSNCESLEFTRLDWSETSSSVSVSYTNVADKYNTGTLTITDPANVRITKNVSEKKADAPYFTTAANARAYAQNQLLTAAYPLSAVVIESNRYAYDLVIGNPIVVSWESYGITKQVFRVTDIDYGSLTEGKIKITAVEDVFGFEKTYYDFSHGIDWDEPVHLPEDVSRFSFMEMPYEITRELNTYINAFACKPSEYTIYWDIWRYYNSAYSVTAKSSKFSIVGRMAYSYDEDYGIDQTGFEIVILGSNGRDLIDQKIAVINSDPSVYNNLSSQNLIVVDGEIMSYSSIVVMPNGNYNLRGIVRGVYDTVPAQHTTESIVFFLDYSQSVNRGIKVCSEGSTSEEQLEITTESADKSTNFELSNITHITTVRRSEAPSVMANLQFSADKGTETLFKYNMPSTTQFSEDILFKFRGRNKFSSYGIIPQTDTDYIQVPSNVENVIRVTCNDKKFEIATDAIDYTGTNVEKIVLNWSDFCYNMGNRLSVTNEVIVDILTHNKDKNLYSYGMYSKTINYIMPRLAGVVQNIADVQAYADSIVRQTVVVIPPCSTCPQTTMTYEDAPLIFVGAINSSGILAQDGNTYTLSTDAYRIDGIDSNGKAIIHKIDVTYNYTLRSNFTSFSNNTYTCYKYTTIGWVAYIPYSV